MPERLLSLSEVLLFGRVVEDIALVDPEASVAETAHVVTLLDVATLKGLSAEGQPVTPGQTILVAGQKDQTQNGRYTVKATGDNPWEDQEAFTKGTLIRVTGGKPDRRGIWEQKMPDGTGKQRFKLIKNLPRRGENKQLQDQIKDDSRFARIYGFSFEGTYYELPNPTLFLVHGEGESATDDLPPEQAARAPFGPSRSGVASADYQIANEIRVWAYDKADYTIRMDAMTGMIEQVLLDIYFGFDSPAISGAKVSGAKVSGAKVSGAKVSGAKVSGAKVSGAKAYGGGD